MNFTPNNQITVLQSRSIICSPVNGMIKPETEITGREAGFVGGTAVLPGTFVAVCVAVGVDVNVAVGVHVAAPIGVFVGVCVGIFVGVCVGV